MLGVADRQCCWPLPCRGTSAGFDECAFLHSEPAAGHDSHEVSVTTRSRVRRQLVLMAGLLATYYQTAPIGMPTIKPRPKK